MAFEEDHRAGLHTLKHGGRNPACSICEDDRLRLYPAVCEIEQSEIEKLKDDLEDTEDRLENLRESVDSFLQRWHVHQRRDGTLRIAITKMEIALQEADYGKAAKKDKDSKNNNNNAKSDSPEIDD